MFSTRQKTAYRKEELAQEHFGDEPLQRNSSSYDSQADGTSDRQHGTA